ncbi:Phenylalanine--tRNA ligase beta subunit [bioreactor metagenome]|uniref:Phenylalanine--tRNA ligase beta subunit n=1 Tax=bioreactor metagenome TaxID=1076179 RepID=A0A645FGP9_9ZZZZ
MYGDADYFTLKGITEGLFNTLGITGARFEAEKGIPYMHSGRTAKILIKGEHVGYIGEVHPKVLENYEIGARVYIGVLDISTLIKNSLFVRKYKALPKFPAVTRDIAVLVKDNVFVEEIEDIIKEKGGKILEEVSLFDVYKGAQIAEGMKSVAYSLKFRASDRTLTDDEVNPVMKEIVDVLKTKLDAVLRDK